MFTAVLIGTAKTIVEYYSPLNRNEILPFALALMELDCRPIFLDGVAARL